MSDQEIFLIGSIASILVAIHLIVHIVQFRKLGKEAEARAESGPPYRKKGEKS